MGLVKALKVAVEGKVIAGIATDETNLHPTVVESFVGRAMELREADWDPRGYHFEIRLLTAKGPKSINIDALKDLYVAR